MVKVRCSPGVTAAALKLTRMVRWIVGDPIATTRQSHFSRFYAPAAAA